MSQLIPMNRPRLFLHATFIAMLAGFSIGRAAEFPAGSPEALVAQLYYLHDTDEDPLSQEDPILMNDYFDESLTDLYLKDRTEAAGEVGKVDFDPLYNARDFNIKDFKIVPVGKKGDSAEVAAQFVNGGVAHKVRFSLSKKPAGWRISNIQYDDGRTLAAILK